MTHKKKKEKQTHFMLHGHSFKIPFCAFPAPAPLQLLCFYNTSNLRNLNSRVQKLVEDENRKWHGEDLRRYIDQQLCLPSSGPGDMFDHFYIVPLGTPK